MKSFRHPQSRLGFPGQGKKSIFVCDFTVKVRKCGLLVVNLRDDLLHRRSSSDVYTPYRWGLKRNMSFESTFTGRLSSRGKRDAPPVLSTHCPHSPWSNELNNRRRLTLTLTEQSLNSWNVLLWRRQTSQYFDAIVVELRRWGTHLYNQV